MGRYYRHVNAAAIADNEALECIAPTCDHQRSDRSQYCLRHARRLRDAGDPVSRLPKAAELKGYRRQLEQQINQLPEETRRRLEDALDEVVRSKLRKPPGWAAGYYSIHGRQPIRAKASIVLANLEKRRVDLTELIVRAMVIQSWCRGRYNGMPQNRERFIQTQIGKLAIRKARLVFTQRIRTQQTDTSVIYYTPNGPKHGTVAVDVEKTAYNNLSGTVARQIGSLVLEASRPVQDLLRGEHERR